MTPSCQLAQMARNAATNSRMRGAGCDQGMEKRRSMCGFTCDPSPSTKRPCEYRARSNPVLASVIGVRPNAIAIDVPSVTCSVASAASSTCRNGSCWVSPVQSPA